MDIQGLAFAAGASRQALEDDMLRRSLSRRVQQLHDQNPAALDQVLQHVSGAGGQLPGLPGRRGTPSMSAGGVPNGATTGPRWSMGGGEDIVRPEMDLGGSVAGAGMAPLGGLPMGAPGPMGSGLTPETPGAFALRQRGIEVAEAERHGKFLDEERATQSALDAKYAQQAYGGTGAYGRGAMGPGAKPPAGAGQPAAAGINPALTAKLSVEIAKAKDAQQFETVKALEAQLAAASKPSASASSGAIPPGGDISTVREGGVLTAAGNTPQFREAIMAKYRKDYPPAPLPAGPATPTTPVAPATTVAPVPAVVQDARQAPPGEVRTLTNLKTGQPMQVQRGPNGTWIPVTTAPAGAPKKQVPKKSGGTVTTPVEG